jgi:REP element-mobilizing transposase RayT
MPDHVRLLIQGTTTDASLVRFVKLAKQLSGYRFAQKTGRRLWQHAYYDHVLRDSNFTGDVVAYILDNPVRAGYVTSPMDYPFSGCTLE